MPAPPHIAIAGGGIAGLATALALARRNMAVTIFEQAPELHEVGAGLQVSPNAWRVLDELGVGDALNAASTAPTGIRIRSGRTGATLARIPLGRAAEIRWGAPYRIVHRADLQTILADAAAESGAELRLDTRIAGFARDGADIRIDLEAGETGRFDGLVGADGLWSAVRSQIVGDGMPRHSRKVAWRTTVALADLPSSLDPTETGLWLGRDAHLVHYAVRGDSELNIIAVLTSDWSEPGWSAPGDPAEIARAFSSWPDLARDIVATPDRWLRWALADRPPRSRWGEGPVTLAGDAAHPMLPFLAQGAAMGIEDAWMLSASLAGAGEVAPAFRRYEARRFARTARVQRAARANGDIYHLGGLAARARDIALSMLGTERLMARWDWLYGWRPAP
jgi:salicylate hydroxylase